MLRAGEIMPRPDCFNPSMPRTLGLIVMLCLGVPASAASYDAAVAKLTQNAYLQLGIAFACRHVIGDMAFWQARAAVVTALRATGASAAQAFEEVNALSTELRIAMPDEHVPALTRCILDHARARKALARSLEEVRIRQQH